MTARKRGRPADISRQGVIETALEIGFRQITMHSIARQLNVSVSALYRHVASKEEVMLLCADEVSKRIDLPDIADWKEFLKALARNYRNTTLAMPGSVEFVREIGLTTPSACGVVEKSLGVFKRSGFDGKFAYMVCIGMISHATDMVLHEEQVIRARDLDKRAEAEAELARMRGIYPNIAWAISDGFSLDREEYFELGLEIYISGIDRMLNDRNRSENRTRLSSH